MALVPLLFYDEIAFGTRCLRGPYEEVNIGTMKRHVRSFAYIGIAGMLNGGIERLREHYDVCAAESGL